MTIHEALMVECLRVADRIVGTDKSVAGLVKTTRQLYDGIVGGAEASSDSSSPVHSASAPPTSHRHRKDKPKGP